MNVACTSRVVFLASLFLFLLFAYGEHAYAQAPGSGIKLIPATVEEKADPGESFEERLTVTNINSEEKEFYLYKRNIKGVGDGGSPIFAESEAEVTGFELSEWLSVSDQPITVPANGEISIPVTITVPDDASPGSHFAGVFISAEPPRLRQTGAGVGYEVASIFSIRISGDINDDARIRSFSTDRLIYGAKDVTFIARVENQGNILIRPRGPLTVTNMLGGEVRTITVNDELRGVFPKTNTPGENIRDFEIEWSDEGIGFGRYTAVLGLVYDGENGQRTIDAATTFWVLPSNVMVPVAVGLVLLIGLVYLLTRLYIRSAVSRAGGTIPARRSRRYRRGAGASRFAFVFASILSVMAVALIILLVLLA